MPNDKMKWAVVGGGFMGMTIAHRLAKQGQDVTIFESSDRLGGLADAWELSPGITWDRHYHVTLLSDTYTRDLYAELELADAVNWVETKTGFYTDDRLFSMSNSLEFLRFPPLDLISKFRLGATIFGASKIRDWRKLEQIPVETWLRKWSGDRAFEKMWLPLLRAKLGDNYKTTSAAFIWATIARMYAARRTGLKKEMFGYVSGGYGRVNSKFEQHLKTHGVDIKTSSQVSGVNSLAGGQVELDFHDEPCQRFDRVVLTLPSPVISRICPNLSSAEHAAHNGIEYQGIVCASMLLNRDLSPYYVTNITDSWVPFTAVIEMSALVNRDELQGRRLVYLPKYVAPDDPLFEKSDQEIQERFVSALERMHPHFSREDVQAFRVSRVRNVVALSTLNYSKSLPPMKTSIPGVYAINSAHIVNGTLNVNETIKLATEATDELLLADVVHQTNHAELSNVEADRQLVAGSR